jgi:hypothetical protein
MITKKNINNKLKKNGMFLTIEGCSESGYYFYPLLDEGTIYFESYSCLKSKIYKDIKYPIKTWLKRAQGLDFYIKNNMN